MGLQQVEMSLNSPASSSRIHFVTIRSDLLTDTVDDLRFRSSFAVVFAFLF